MIRKLNLMVDDMKDNEKVIKLANYKTDMMLMIDEDQISRFTTLPKTRGIDIWKINVNIDTKKLKGNIKITIQRGDDGIFNYRVEKSDRLLMRYIASGVIYYNDIYGDSFDCGKRTNKIISSSREARWLKEMRYKDILFLYDGLNGYLPKIVVSKKTTVINQSKINAYIGSRMTVFTSNALHMYPLITDDTEVIIYEQLVKRMKYETGINTMQKFDKIFPDYNGTELTISTKINILNMSELYRRGIINVSDVTGFLDAGFEYNEQFFNALNEIIEKRSGLTKYIIRPMRGSLEELMNDMSVFREMCNDNLVK